MGAVVCHFTPALCCRCSVQHPSKQEFTEPRLKTAVAQTALLNNENPDPGQIEAQQLLNGMIRSKMSLLVNVVLCVRTLSRHWTSDCQSTFIPLSTAGAFHE